MRALVDGDILAYSSAAITDGKRYNITLPDGRIITERLKKDIAPHCLRHGVEMEQIEVSYNPDPIANACHIIKLKIAHLIKTLEIADGEIYLSDCQNHRYLVDPLYKANRAGTRKPAHLSECKRYLIERWNAKIMTNLECDDVLGILQTEGNKAGQYLPDHCDTVICTIDKDLDMIPGWHYNWQKNKVYWVTRTEARRWFYTQLITGDPTDNIPGLSEKRPKTRTFSTEPLQTMTGEEEMYRYVLHGYEDKYGKRAGEELHRNGNLLWILQEKDQYWRTI